MKIIYKDANDAVLLEILRLNNDNTIKSVTVSESEFQELWESVIGGAYTYDCASIKIKCHFSKEEYVLMLSTNHIVVYVDATI